MKASSFRCKVYEPAFEEVIKSYQNKQHHKHICLAGGGASGKSQFVIRNAVFTLPEVEKDEMAIIVYSVIHKNNTVDRIRRVMFDEGINHTAHKYDDGRTRIRFGNNNSIVVMSIKTSSVEETEEKLKTFITESTNNLKYIWFEEFTATLNVFKTIDKFKFAVTRLYRELKGSSIIWYSFNPPNNKKHPVYSFLEGFEGLRLHSTLFDLPKEWQSEEDLKEAESMKLTNPKQYKHIYLGERVGDDCLAFSIDESIWVELGDYLEFVIMTDEGTVNATTFWLYGLSTDGKVHAITSYYHSSKMDGVRKSPSTYASEFVNWFNELGINKCDVYTDGIPFAQELKKKGFNAKSVTSLKDRPLSYYLLNKIVINGDFKIVDRGENIMLFLQMTNAEIDYNNEGKPMVSKKHEGGNSNEKHTHALDTLLYYCLLKQKLILKGEANVR